MNYLLFQFGLVVLTILNLFSLISDTNVNVITNSLEQELIKNMQSLRERLREAEFQNSERSQDLISLKTKLSELLREKARGTEQSNSSKKSSNVFYKDNNVLQMPSIYNFMPHLLDSPSSLKPALHVSQEREKGKMFTENLIAFYCFCDKCTCCKLKRISSENCVQPTWMQSLFSLVS